MHVAIVRVQVRPEHVQDFIIATRANHEASVNETGNCRFDVLQSESDPTYFILYEAYDTAEQASAHKLTPHYLAWRDMVMPWMATPRIGEFYHALFPAGYVSPQ